MLQTESKSMSQPETDMVLNSNLKSELEDLEQILYELPPTEHRSMHEFLEGAKFMMNIIKRSDKPRNPPKQTA